ncbi:MAG TPA: WhiB family transcriptional regulator [Streptosporangiaceae bacterium]|nr:WhiB family transcriptional regulator [Streptosporangiaceae bacterium]
MPSYGVGPPGAGKLAGLDDVAKAICARCLIRSECLAFALRTHQVHGA